MNDFFKWLARTLAIAVIWVFIFSINVKGQTIFHYANDVLVQNTLVRTIDSELSDLWGKAVTSVKLTFRSAPAGDEKGQAPY